MNDTTGTDGKIQSMASTVDYRLVMVYVFPENWTGTSRISEVTKIMFGLVPWKHPQMARMLVSSNFHGCVCVRTVKDAPICILDHRGN